MAHRRSINMKVAVLVVFIAAIAVALDLPHDIHDMHGQMQQRMKQHLQEFSKLQRRLAQDPTVARANAVAQNGANVKAVSTAEGPGSSSDVTAKGSGPETVIDCRQQAAGGQDLTKVCADWINAPRCIKEQAAADLTLDAAVADRAWGYENGASCAYKNEDNTPRSFDKSKAKQP